MTLRPGQTQSVRFDGLLMWVSDSPREGSSGKFRVRLIVKPFDAQGVVSPGGDEVRVTLDSPPESSIAAGDRVELVEPYVQAYEFTTHGGTATGLIFKAAALHPAL
ncbi:hypothetical protein FHR84_002602 [Actinopolyspora biskrensis]|uniref:Uncharacterized protein n=1 Tax=Actinopolyspora biskrensis TaxID=1470178 RepID=A0A852YYM2_9ACTN|nr:hypothetical protein [Actinopolyspora biskrensis]NYH79268.1 hypothetical protein [Actinopolyspora biskrensis]